MFLIESKQPIVSYVLLLVKIYLFNQDYKIYRIDNNTNYDSYYNSFIKSYSTSFNVFGP